MNAGTRVRVIGDTFTKGETGKIVGVAKSSPLPYNVTLDNGETDWFYSADELEVIK